MTKQKKPHQNKTTKLTILKQEKNLVLQDFFLFSWGVVRTLT